MPKATLEFSLPDEREEFLDAQRGTAYHAVINDLSNLLRSKRKYDDQTVIEIEFLEAWLRDELSDISG